MEDIIKDFSIICGYETEGIDAYYKIVKETKKIKQDMKQLEKEIGKKEAKYIYLISKIDVLVGFLSLKILTNDDKETLTKELYSLSKELKELYELGGE